MKLHIETPLIESRALSMKNKGTVWLKLDAMQPPGSIKIRGIGAACQAYAQRGAQHFISSSGGNAGIAMAYAGRHLSIPVTVVVPETTTERAKQLIRGEGAELVVHGASWQEANELALSLVGKGDTFVHPFDDPLLWPGHATMIDEVAAAGLMPDVVVVAVGGGGLLCGIVEGLHRNNWASVPIIAVETEGADSFHQAVQADRLVELPGITSIATSLGARQICQQALDWSRQHPISTVVVSDRAAVSACLRFIEDHRIVVEPACGAALAVAYDETVTLAPYQNVLIIVCGGVNTSVAQLNRWAQQTG